MSEADNHTKSYACTTARIKVRCRGSFTLTMEVVKQFLKRREIELVYGPVEHWLSLTIFVQYTVHGGFASDFRRKIEADATLVGAKIAELEITCDRKEMPQLCPRELCTPCQKK